jgi:hypothetical protein
MTDAMRRIVGQERLLSERLAALYDLLRGIAGKAAGRAAEMAEFPMPGL